MEKVGTLIISFLLIFSISQSVFAEEASSNEVTRLTITDAVSQAVEGNIGLKQSAISLRTAQKTASVSWNPLIPHVTASAQVSHSFIEPGINSVSVGGNVNLSLNPSIYTSIRSATLSYEQQQITYENAQRTIQLNVCQAFYSLLYGKEYLTILKNNVESAERQYESDRAKYNRGRIQRMNVLQDQVQLQSAQLSYDSQRNSYENSLASFKQILGLSQDTQIELEGDLDFVLSLGEITREQVEAVRKTSSTMESLEKQREQAKNSLLATRFSAWGPSVSLSYNLGWSGSDAGGMNMATGKQTKGDFEMSSEPTSHSISLGVSIPLDGLLPWSSGGRSVAAQKDNLESLELSIENQRTTEEISIQNYLNTIASTQANIRLAKSNADLAEENYRLTRDAYEYGTKSLLELQTARDNLNSARVSVLSNANTLITAVLNLENLIGVPYGTLTGNSY